MKVKKWTENSAASHHKNVRPCVILDLFLNDQEFDNEVASINSQTNIMDQNASIDSQLNSKENDDKDDYDD